MFTTISFNGCIHVSDEIVMHMLLECYQFKLIV